MDVFSDIISGYPNGQSGNGRLIIVCTHATFSTYLLCLALKSKGFKIAFLPVSYSKNQEYIDALVRENIDIITEEDLLGLIGGVDLAIEDGARVSRYVAENKLRVKKTFFTVEQTSGGVRYLTSHVPSYPVIDVAFSSLKLDIENRRATPEAIIQQYSERTGQTLGGKRVLVLGFGSIGEGIARFARVLGARVTVFDSSSVRAVFARHRGYHIAVNSKLNSVLGVQDVVFMATNRYTGDILNIKRILLLKDGAVIVNAGSGHGELDERLWRPLKGSFHDAQIEVKETAGHLIVSSEKAGNKKTVTVLGAGYPVNLHLGKGTSHDAIQFVMAMLFLAVLDGPRVYQEGIQPLSSTIQEHIATSYIKLEDSDVFEPTYVQTEKLNLSERPYGGIYAFHNHLNDRAHFAVVKAWFSAGSKTRGHYHLRSQESYYVVKGRAKIITWKYDEPNAVKKTHKMHTGDYLLVPEGYFHDVIVSDTEDLEVLVISSPPFQMWDQFFEEEIDE